LYPFFFNFSPTPGFYCDATFGAVNMSVLQPCPKGHYCPEGTGIAKQFPCPIGTYNPRELMDSQSDCLLCPSGHYCPDVGLEEPTGETSVKKSLSVKILKQMPHILALQALCSNAYL